jgi:hypothetical protein
MYSSEGGRERERECLCVFPISLFLLLLLFVRLDAVQRAPVEVDSWSEHAPWEVERLVVITDTLHVAVLLQLNGRDHRLATGFFATLFETIAFGDMYQLLSRAQSTHISDIHAL